MKKRISSVFDVHKVDARKLNTIISKKLVDVTITSPPYFDLKDYGHDDQIGYGQEYTQYLKDLNLVFKNVYDCTKDTGTLWVIIDSFRENNEVIPLPFDFSNEIKSTGWKLQDVIIWTKDRTVPWTHKGQMRNLFEYILVFSKSEKYNFYIDEVRDFQVLKKWWVKYPERYNPRGKVPSGLWHFDIPTQGSWGNGYIRHFCPLPEEMIAQILKLTTKEGDVVLDPFSGSGAVLAKAENMYRKFIGFELNGSYIKMFRNYLKKTSKKNRELYVKQKSHLLPQQQFEALITNLRILKLAKILFSKLSEENKKIIVKIFVERLKTKISKKNAVCIAKYHFLLNDKIVTDKFYKQINELLLKPPLSKYGVETCLVYHKNINSFLKALGERKVYTYTNKITHHFKAQIHPSDLLKAEKSEIILSKIKVELNEKDYD